VLGEAYGGPYARILVSVFVPADAVIDDRGRAIG
jgi:hypothetical protein